MTASSVTQPNEPLVDWRELCGQPLDATGLPAVIATTLKSSIRRAKEHLFYTDSATIIERGKVTGISKSVIDAIGRALELDEAERSHLFKLHRRADRIAARLLRSPDSRRLESSTGFAALSVPPDPAM
ncbi:hypothetical protein [Rhodococcus sp. ACPA4]|uniref:hypothetical protein n=1 Tax=Rhodococcus sp. ACPA4 TaxID=2028571 RepID=UPI00211CEDCE|nr:hypothetical protein [Rhodococcus sp. ACPA4]